MDQLVESNIKFGLDILKTIASNKPTENLFVSPFSIQTAMAMLHLGTRNNSKAEVEKVLYFDFDSVHGSLGEYLQILNQKQSSYALSSANRVFINNKYKFLEEYLQTLQATYKAEAQTCDFISNAEGEKEKINKWVEGETNSKIKDLIPSGVLNPLTAMVLVNAIYFKGNWENQFEVRNTLPRMFRVDSSKHVEVLMMTMEKKFKFGQSDDLDCSILELPYVKKDLSMVLLLPQKIDGVTSLVNNLTPSKLSKLMKEMKEVKVDIALPKFKLEADLNLKEVLINLGLSDIFDTSKADLSGIDGTRELYVSDAIHKAFVEVNEEGTEAAAATVMVMQLLCLEILPKFHADHPFLFFIRDNRKDMILFWGKLQTPDGPLVNTPNEEI
ncbi:leukocyte elastase inhibitor [Patella vulgata]|uniref:leukocyte elastase inhibitor n=1 Tax=Patella vulgata TaxID=6465 RepID=UPI00217FC8B0|nr:leukocyte elastase inhibitor [Patella vulgata]XP_050395827.1 leukocyte elastase inhibitor [Patella vulgata]XP_050395835.1 leukocyte elastase inhibitor [Patella vulgata]XP_050395839.1 leukocyte elastase inhibitor [Patella vulgata]